MIKFTNKLLQRNFRKFTKNQFKLFSAIGVDMGGTNTCIAIVEPSGPRIIENAEGKGINLNIYNRFKINSFNYSN
jgi:molecular chaperone DnaK (HSP70)